MDELPNAESSRQCQTRGHYWADEDLAVLGHAEVLGAELLHGTLEAQVTSEVVSPFLQMATALPACIHENKS